MKSIIVSCIAAVGIMMLTACNVLPTAQPYPYEDPASVRAKAQQYSDALEAYIQDWLAGKVPALIPESILPPGVYLDDFDPAIRQDTNPNEAFLRNISLANPATMSPVDYTVVRPAYLVNQTDLTAQFPDPHCTYLHTMHYVPFGSKTVVKGKFPRCRFFMYTITDPLNGLQYNNGPFGPPEVPLVDVDIVPDAGSVNPFIAGANRNATQRNYTIEFINKIDNMGLAADQYCPKPPFFRSTGNTRYGGGILPKGPGLEGFVAGQTQMYWTVGVLWARYYMPDRWGTAGFDPLAGVPLPTIYHQLATGEKFMTVTDMKAKKAWSDKKFAPITTNNNPPDDETPSWGWKKMYGILGLTAAGLLQSYGFTSAEDKQWLRDYVKGVEGRGTDLPAPGNWEPHATCVPYINYMCRGIKLDAGNVTVLTGKLPTFPETRNGEATMGKGQMRYFSICANESIQIDPTNPQGDPNNSRQPGVLTASVADSEIKLDSQRRYIICWSRAQDRPSNATAANGVTWVNWGPNSDTHWTLRWLTVSPDWYFSKSPTSNNLPWSTGAWEEPGFNNALISENKRTGWLGEYLPVNNYMSKACFESLGSPVTWAKVDAMAWGSTCSNGGCGAPLAAHKGAAHAVLLPLLLAVCAGIGYRMKKKNG